MASSILILALFVAGGMATKPSTMRLNVDSKGLLVEDLSTLVKPALTSGKEKQKVVDQVERALSAPVEEGTSYGRRNSTASLLNQTLLKEQAKVDPIDPCPDGFVGFRGATPFENGKPMLRTTAAPKKRELERGERFPRSYVVSKLEPNLLNDFAVFYCPGQDLDFVTGKDFDDLLPNQQVVSQVKSDEKKKPIETQVEKLGYYPIKFARSGCTSMGEGARCQTGKFVVLNHHGTVQALKLAAPILIKIKKANKQMIAYPGKGWTETRLLTGDKDTEVNFNCAMGVLTPADKKEFCKGHQAK